MKLVKARVRNFRCIDDSEEFAIDQVTCLVGKNEAGKSALLTALHKLNPVEPPGGQFVEDDFPRRHLIQSRAKGEIAGKPAVITVWSLEKADLEIIEREFGQHAISNTSVTVSKGYDNSLKWTISISEPAIVKHILSSAQLTEAQMESVKSSPTIAKLADMLDAFPPFPAPADPAQAQPPDNSKSVAQSIRNRFPGYNATDFPHISI